jgi:protein-disulfide isomerase
MRRGKLGFVALCALLLLACAAPPVAQVEPEPVAAPSPARTALPSVTPILLPSATHAPIPASPTRTPTPTFAPTPTPGLEGAISFDAEGAITPPMAGLKLGGERYATLGSPEAPVTMVEVSDYGCPSCRWFHLRAFPTLLSNYIETGKVYYVFKDYPIVSPLGNLAAQAAECAGEQGDYWAMHRELFLSAEAWNGTDPEAARTAFRALAAQVGLDGSALDACIAEGRYAEEVAGDAAEAQAVGFSGTPTFVVNKNIVIGGQALEVFVDLIDRELLKSTAQ